MGSCQTTFDDTPSCTGSTAPYIVKKKLQPKPSAAFDTYWHFAAKRQQIFYSRLKATESFSIDDPILQIYKFTNAYRASDRVSQFLIRNVIYSRKWSLRDTVFRVLLFKIFNKIETWNILEQAFGSIEYSKFDVNRYAQCLDRARAKGMSIYSAAYIMPAGPRSKYSATSKHRFHLSLLSTILREDLHLRLREQKSLSRVFQTLLRIDSFGRFLAYQFTIDLNYSDWIDFSENDFVVPGPGAIDGIKKCFTDLREYSAEDAIRMMQEEQEHHFARLGIKFDSLWGRPLHLIDCQNLFCEVDKYSRVAHPELSGISGRTRIKQKYRPKPPIRSFWYPPKWGLNSEITRHPLGIAELK